MTADLPHDPSREFRGEPARSQPTPGWIRGAEGTGLRTWSWRVRNPRGRIQITHGFSEHLRRYDQVAAVLNGAGWSVFGHDHRGHGESEGRRGVLRDFGHLVEDLGRVRREADDLAPGPGVPVLLGHSMGGLVLIRYLQTEEIAVPQAVVSAPWLGTTVDIPFWKRMAARVLLPLAPNVTLANELDTSRLTRDPDRAAAYRADPRVHRRASAGFLNQARKAQRSALDGEIPRNTRLLLLVPLDDRIADAEVTLEWARRVRDPSRVRIETIPEGRHEPFQDVNRNEVFRTVVQWLDEAGDGATGSRTERDMT